MEYNVPIILMAQINRELQNNSTPTLNMLKESGSIEEDSDNVIMIHQPDAADTFKTPSEIIIRKQRNGQRDVVIDANYYGRKFIFDEINGRY